MWYSYANETERTTNANGSDLQEREKSREC